MNEKKLVTFRVKGSTDTHKLAGCIKKASVNDENFEISAMGASAVNQAMKACTVANSFLQVEGKHILSFIPGFRDTVIKDTEGVEHTKSSLYFSPIKHEIEVTNDEA